MKKCSICGCEVNDKFAYCPQCGNKLKEENTDAVWPEFPETDPYNQDGFYNDDSVNSNEEKRILKKIRRTKIVQKSNRQIFLRRKKILRFPGLLITTGRHMRILTKR